jgi:hypothetical protein
MAEPQKNAVAEQKQTHIFIRNNEDRIRGVAKQPRNMPKKIDDLSPKTVLNLMHQHVTFKPGINRLEMSEWESVKKNAEDLLHAKTAESKGKPVLEIVRDEAGNGGYDLISQTFDRELLRDMLEKAPNQDLVAAIQAQLKRISPREGLDGTPIADAMSPLINKQRAEGHR